jgi:putative glutamine amidotransferase
VTGPTVILGWPKTDYCLALQQAGATPVVVTPERDPVDMALSSCHGLLLTGGADVDPAYYGAEPHPAVTIVPGRDDYELALARGAMARDLPTLAICRGIQLLNVAAGGTLVQDLPSQRPSSVRHSIKEPQTAIAHAIRVVPETRLGAILRPDGNWAAIEVNSRHHQAVDRLAPGFLVSAVAPDGVVEGIERPESTFCVGVQWHPENYWATGDFAALFHAFVEACRGVRS